MATVKLVASGYTGLTGMSVSGSYPMTRAYEDSSDTSNYARCSISTSTTGYVYLTYDTSAIPANAQIQSVTAKARLRISSASRVTNRVCQLYSGTTAKGTNVDFSSTSSGGSVVSPSADTWTRSELNNLRMRIGGTGSSSSQSKYIYIYGTDIEITYTEASVPVTGVSVSPATASIGINETVTLTETVTPSNATDKSVTWSSSNTAVATVSNGVVTGVAAGSATITVTTTDGGYTDTCVVTVTGGGAAVWTTVTDTYLSVVSSSPNYIWLSNYTTPFQDGETYRVTWGNTTYICQTQVYNSSNCQDGYGIGDQSIVGGQASGNNEPFFLFRTTMDVNTLIGGTTTAAGSIYLKIEKLVSGGSPPVITVGTPTRTIISDETGYDQCVCTFTSDTELSEWEARATKAGVTPARGVGLLVESGGSLAAGVTGTVYVDDEELTQGDGEYTITVYGKSTSGVWSE